MRSPWAPVRRARGCGLVQTHCFLGTFTWFFSEKSTKSDRNSTTEKSVPCLERTSRTHSHKALNLLAISFMGHIDLKNNENRIKRFQRGAECALQDAMRPGAPATFRAEQWCQIIALACEPPEASGRPISHWTPRELADEARKRGMVTTLSERHVGRFLKSGRAQTAQKPLLAEYRA